MDIVPETAQKNTVSVNPSLVQSDSPSPAQPEESESGLHVCEVCGAYFETKRGLSSHCRSHLRQLGVGVSDSSGAPISLLYQIILERDGKLPFPSGQNRTETTKTPQKHKTPKIPQSPPSKSLQPSPPKISPPLTPKHSQTPLPQTTPPQLTPPKTTSTQATPPQSPPPKPTPSKAPTSKTPLSKISSPKKDSTTKLKIKISTLVKKYSKSSAATSAPPTSTGHTPSPPKHKKLSTEPKRCPVPVPPPVSPVLSSKPLWAPQETDAPLNLTAMSDPTLRPDVHVCELCGAWYETRKGLSSHARAHLRQFGVPADAKGAPIDLLHELLLREEQGNGVLSSPTPPKHPDTSERAHATPNLAPKRPAPLSPEPEGPHTPPPPKKHKTSPGAEEVEPRGDVPRDALRDARCEFCNEKFKTSQSLASHARSHLRLLGVTDWTVHGSPMATLRDLMSRRGVTTLPNPHALPTKNHTSPKQPHPLNTENSATPTKSHAPPLQSHTPPITPLTTPTKSHTPLTQPLTYSPPPEALLPLSPGSAPSAACPTPPRVPKARKGSRLVFAKPKDELVETNISTPEASKAMPKNTAPPSGSSQETSNGSSGTELKVECDYCGEMFESRKALSCHARAHLRQMSVRWCPNASPIDALQQLLQRERAPLSSDNKPQPAGGRRASSTSSSQSGTSSPVELLREKADAPETAAGCEPTCDLCGFDFENRKALASHARAHLRQLGVDWRENGSPIETLAEWMRKEPQKVADLHRRYMKGDLPQVNKKRSTLSPHPSFSDTELARPGPHRDTRGPPSTLSAPRRPPAPQHTHTHSSNRGYERRPPKLLPHGESRLGAGSLKPRVGNAPSLMPRPPENSLVKLVGKVYSLKCRFCEEVFKGPLSVQEDWLIHLQQHILNLKRDSAPISQSPAPTVQSPAPTLPLADTAQLIGPEVV